MAEEPKAASEGAQSRKLGRTNSPGRPKLLRANSKAPSHIRQSSGELDDKALREIYRDLDSTGFHDKVSAADSFPSHRFIIEPLSPWRIMWDMLTFAIIGYQVLTVPVDLAFLPDASNSETFSAWWWLENFTAIVFVADLVINCFTAYIRDNGICVRKQRLILHHYFCVPPWYAVMDLLSLLPFIFNFLQTNNDGAGTATLTKVTKTGRFLRYVRLLRLLRLLRITTAFHILNKLSHVMVGGGPYMLFISALCKLLLGFCFMSHMGACAWRVLCDFHTQAEFYHIDEDDPWQSYSVCLWWMVATLAATQPPTQPTTVEDIWVWCGFSILSAAILSIGIGILVQICERFAEADEELKEKLHITHRFFARAALPEVLKAKVLGAIRAAAKHDREQGKFKALVEPLLSRDLLQQLHGNIHGALIKRFPPFQDEEVPARFLYRLAYEATVRRYSVGDVILAEGQVATTMIFLIEGRALLRSVAQRMELPIVMPGWWLGEKVLFWSKDHGSDRPTRSATCRALLPSSTLELNDQHFQMAVEEYKLGPWLRRMQAKGVAGLSWGCPHCGEDSHWLTDCDKDVDNADGLPSSIRQVGAETFERGLQLAGFDTVVDPFAEADTWLSTHDRASFSRMSAWQSRASLGSLISASPGRLSTYSVGSIPEQGSLLLEVLAELQQTRAEVQQLRAQMGDGLVSEGNGAAEDQRSAGDQVGPSDVLMEEQVQHPAPPPSPPPAMRALVTDGRRTKGKLGGRGRRQRTASVPSGATTSPNNTAVWSPALARAVSPVPNMLW